MNARMHIHRWIKNDPEEETCMACFQYALVQGDSGYSGKMVWKEGKLDTKMVMKIALGCLRTRAILGQNAPWGDMILEWRLVNKTGSCFVDILPL